MTAGPFEGMTPEEAFGTRARHGGRHPRQMGGASKGSMKGKREAMDDIIADAMKRAKTEPPDYFDLAGRRSNFSQNWQAGNFSHQVPLDEHVDKHIAGLGISGRDEYVKKAREFLHSPLGDTGDVFVTRNGTIFKYDYETTTYAIARDDGYGTIGTFKNLSAQEDGNGKPKGKKWANRRWEAIKRENQNVEGK